MTNWFTKSTGWYGQPGRAHILARRDGPDRFADFIAVCGLRADFVEVNGQFQSEHRPYNACLRCAPGERE